MLSFDISDKQINIVKGENNGTKIKIDKSFALEVPDEMIINGEVINITGLADLLTKTINSEQMMDRDAIVTFSSSSIVFKELIVPSAKGNEFLAMVQNHMSQEMGITDEYSISYTVVGDAGEDNPGCVKVLATACPSTIVDRFRKLFSIMNVNLRSVNIGCNSIARIVLADKTNKEKMPLLVCQIDKSFLGLTLFENGQMAFARYVPISPEDYDSEDYILEALNENIFRMEQFNKARGGSGLSNVILYGVIDDYIKIVDALDSLDIKASVLGVPAQITGFENFEFTVFANAIGALYKRDKRTERINLLEVDTATGKDASGVSSMLVTAGVFVAASAVIIAAATLFIHLKENSIKKDIKAKDEEIAKCNKKIAENAKLQQRLDIINLYKDYVLTAENDIKTKPRANKDDFDTIDKVIKKQGAEYKSFTFDLESGSLTIGSILVDKKEQVKSLVDALSDLDFIKRVDYTGYGPNDKDNEASKSKADKIKIDTLVLTFKEGEIK